MSRDADVPASKGSLRLVVSAIRRLVGRHPTGTERNITPPAVTVYEFTHIGHREENQDRLATFRSPDGKAALLVVADGLGGHSGGALAAQTVIETAEGSWASLNKDQDPEGFLKALALECHEAVNRARDSSGLDPRSTLAALLFRGSEIVSVHAGDSRVMQFSDSGLAHRTLDHSVAQLNVMMGAISEEEQGTHSSQSRLFSHVGGESVPDVDIRRWEPAEGRRFVICSDGFWEIFPPDEILDIFNASDRSTELETRFLRKFEDLEKHDNTTAILAEVDLSRPRPPRRGIRSFLRRAGTYAVPSALCVAALMRGDASGAARPRSTWLLAQVVESESAKGSTRNGQVESETNPAGQSDRTQRTPIDESPAPSDQQVPDAPLPIEYVQLEVNREVGPQEAVSEIVAEELRRLGEIGAGSELTASGSPRQLAARQTVRLQQSHKGVRVFGAEVTAITEKGRIVKIQGHPAQEIEIDTRPARSYPETVALAKRLIDRDIERLGTGTVVIFPLGDDNYRLAWEGLVRIDRGDERVAFDAETGKILLRQPVALRR